MTRLVSVLALLLLPFGPAFESLTGNAGVPICTRSYCTPIAPDQERGTIDVNIDQSFPAAPGTQSAGTPAIPGPAGPAGPAAPTNPQTADPATNQAPQPGACIGTAVAAAPGAPDPCTAPPAAPAAPARAAQSGRAPITTADIRQVVQRYMQRIPLPAPGIHLNPARPAIVNFPTIVNADPPPASHFVVSEPGFPRIDITATCHWQWDYGDGTITTSDWPGRPYDGTLPADDPRHYLLHAYRAPATLRVTVTAVWSATYTVAGQPGTTPMPGTVNRASSTTLPVREYAAALVP